MGPHPFRVQIPEPKLRAHVSEILSDYLCPAADHFLGFKVESPAKATGIYVLTSGSGAVLGRARSGTDVAQILVNHLTGRLADDPAPGILRVDLRLVSTESRTALIGPKLATKPTFIERALEREGMALLDAPFVDVDPETARIKKFAIDAPSLVSESVGAHLSPTDFESVVTDLLWPGEHLPEELSSSLVTREIARHVRNGDRAFRMRSSRTLAERLTVRLVGSPDSRDVMDALV